MPCYQSKNLPSGFSTIGRTSYKTEAECVQACQEGACCEGTTCSVKPECQCPGPNKTFKGVGTTCDPNPCLCCCEFFDLHAGGVSVTQQADSTCVASNNRAIGPCVSSPLVISVSGFTTPVLPDDPGWLVNANTDLSFANTSRATREICGQSGLYLDGPYDLITGGFFVASSLLTVNSWFSPYDSLHDASSDRCNNGSVRFRVELLLERIYRLGSYSTPYILQYKGFHKGDCASLDSLPVSSSMLAGKTVIMTCDGTLTVPGSIYAAVPQLIIVSFAANPLP